MGRIPTRDLREARAVQRVLLRARRRSAASASRRCSPPTRRWSKRLDQLAQHLGRPGPPDAVSESATWSGSTPCWAAASRSAPEPGRSCRAPRWAALTLESALGPGDRPGSARSAPGPPRAARRPPPSRSRWQALLDVERGACSWSAASTQRSGTPGCCCVETRPTVAGLVTDLHAVNCDPAGQTASASRCSASLVGFQPTGLGRRLGLVYLYKRGTFYPFAPGRAPSSGTAPSRSRCAARWASTCPWRRTWRAGSRSGARRGSETVGQAEEPMCTTVPSGSVSQASRSPHGIRVGAPSDPGPSGGSPSAAHSACTTVASATWR